MKGEQRKMKKFFKKVMVVALVVAMSTVGVRVEKAEAAGHDHVEVKVILTAREGGYIHQVELYSKKWDPWGNEVLVQDGYLNCAVSRKDYYYVKRCKYCYKNLYYDWLEGWENHSYIYCPLG